MAVDPQTDRVRRLLEAASAGSKLGIGSQPADESESVATVIGLTTPARVALILSDCSDEDILDQLLSDALHAPD